MKMDKMAPPTWVDTPQTLKTMLTDLLSQTRVAVDTESNSLYAYREQICLIQFSTPNTDYLVDPLALDDLSMLGEIFASPDILKVFHAVEYDLICLHRDFGFEITNLFDTMLAARVLGRKSIGLDSLLKQHFNVSLDKRFQRANWGKRPLPEDMLNYARLDTRYLLALKEDLNKELAKKGLQELAQEDFVLACQLNHNQTHANGCQNWERLGNNQGLNMRELTTLSYLCQARENLAKQLDRPPFKVMSDKQLLQIVQVKPATLRDLEKAGLSERQIKRFGKEMLNGYKTGNKAPLVKRSPVHRPDEDFLLRYDALREWRKNVAKRNSVTSDIILPRRIMSEIAQQAPHSLEALAAVMAKSPWRFKNYGKEILRILATI